MYAPMNVRMVKTAPWRPGMRQVSFEIWGAIRDPNLPPSEQTAKEDALITVGNISPVYTKRIAKVADIAKKLKKLFNSPIFDINLNKIPQE